MLTSRSLLILALIPIFAFAAGCARRATREANNTTSDKSNSNRTLEPGMDGARDNADELRTLIRLPYDPEDLVWKEYPANASNGGSRRRLLAVLQFSPADSRKIVESAAKIRPGNPISLSSEDWFPKELVTQSEMSSGDGIQATAYSANDFLLPPFDQGSISHVNDTDFFVLELFAK